MLSMFSSHPPGGSEADSGDQGKNEERGFAEAMRPTRMRSAMEPKGLFSASEAFFSVQTYSINFKHIQSYRIMSYWVLIIFVRNRVILGDWNHTPRFPQKKRERNKKRRRKERKKEWKKNERPKENKRNKANQSKAKQIKASKGTKNEGEKKDRKKCNKENELKVDSNDLRPSLGFRTLFAQARLGIGIPLYWFPFHPFSIPFPSLSIGELSRNHPTFQWCFQYIPIYSNDVSDIFQWCFLMFEVLPMCRNVSHGRLDDLKQKKRRKDLQDTDTGRPRWRDGKMWRLWRPRPGKNEKNERPKVEKSGKTMPFLGVRWLSQRVFEVFLHISTAPAGDPGNSSNSQCATVPSPAKPFHYFQHRNVTGFHKCYHSVTTRITQVLWGTTVCAVLCCAMLCCREA